MPSRGPEFTHILQKGLSWHPGRWGMLFRRDLSVSFLGGENLGLGAIRILLAQPFCQNYLKINGMAEGRGSG